MPDANSVGNAVVDDIRSKTEVRLTHYIKFFTGRDDDAKDDISKWSPSDGQGEALLEYMKKIARDIGRSLRIPKKEVGVLYHSLKGEYVRVTATGVTKK